jgi:two-component system response regulator (stage 0 sporulation protein F)
MKPSILIVDDQYPICYGLERLLSEEYVIYKALNGMEALEIIRHNSDIDIILTDIMMPVMDGIEMIEKVRLDNKDIIIIAMTAVFSGEKINEVIEKGANQCLMKPLDIPQLELTLKKSIENKKTAGTA